MYEFGKEGRGGACSVPPSGESRFTGFSRGKPRLKIKKIPMQISMQLRSLTMSAHVALAAMFMLARALSGQSQGLAHASSTSNLLSHLTFASTRGGRPLEVPPAHSNAGGNASDEAHNDDGAGNGTERNEGNSPTTSSPPENANENGVDNANGGASSGGGGNGGAAAAGGLVRAGSVVSNANALNMLNTVILRIRGN